ncbi:MAG TPA: 6-pyruvoyl-tetrahydropterin synthase-related protein, partial [Anaerolineae bacterium]|nr:6-pyruvoyl-tetrahydropterin synthase-related protein [Anaerolineae bacterium]
LPISTGPGLINTRGGGDSPFLFIRLHQLVANLHDGVFPARWMPDAAYGLGYPFFNYYASLPYYFGAIFNLIGFDLLISIKIVQTLGFVLAAFAMYRWTGRHVSDRLVSWLIALAYLAAPFHFVNIYVRGDSLSEFYAFVFYPLILLAIDRVIESPRVFYWLAFAYGGLLLTHNVSALIFSPFALLYALIGLSKSGIRNQKSKLLGLVAGFGLALALSAWFWLPALSESKLVQLQVQSTGYFNYAGHFRSIDLIQPSFGFDYSLASTPGASTPFAMGLAQALATLFGLTGMLITWRQARDKSWRLFALIGLALSTFMITPWSQALWDHLPLLPFAQFPWRFLSVQSLFTSMVIGYAVGVLAARKRARIIGSTLIGLILIATVFLPLRPAYLPIRADEITAQRIQLYESFTTNIGTTIRGEYLPNTVVPHPLIGQMLIDSSASPQVIVASGQATADLTAHASIQQTWQVRVDSDRSVIDFPVIDWPDWQAAVDGQRVEAKAAPDLGYLQIEVPNGNHQVDLSLARTPIRVLGETLSLAALIALAAYLS